MKRIMVYLGILLVVALLGMYGCPKKTEVSSAPEPTGAQAAQQNQEQVEPARPAEGTSGAETAGRTPESERTGISAEGLKPLYFDYDSSTIRDDQKDVMRANAAWLKGHPKAKIRIEGNCDERGTREYNQALGQRRAVSAKKYLVALGVSGSRISLISYGKEKPVCTEDSEGCWKKNRKDDFSVTS